VITGAESTGKSALTRQLSRCFLAPSFPEYAREAVTKLNRHYLYSDVEAIAAMQRSQMEIASKLQQEYVFFDTWLIITQVWFEVVFNRSPRWIPGLIRNSPVDLFLVCNTDIPWVPDPVRENGGEMRRILSEKYIEYIHNYGFQYHVVSGTGNQRIDNAVEFIRHI
jgi:nicotinamide riboside kinase